MLSRESQRQTIRLILMNAYQKKKSNISKMYIELYRKCSTLFDSLLSRSKQQSLRSSRALLENDDENSSIALQSDSMHRQIIAIECLSFKYCREVLELFTQASDVKLMTFDFKSQLRNALKKNFDILNVMHFETTEIQ